MDKEHSLLGFILTVVGILLTVAVLGFLFWFFPTYNVWSRELQGKATLREAEWDRKVQVEEAQANLEAQKLNAQAEVERAKGLAEAQEIVSSTLNEQYLRYLWIEKVEGGENKQTIYIPTENGLPLLEAGRIGK